MTNNDEICRHAFSLVKGQPEGAGLTICLAGGDKRFISPTLSGSGLEMSMLQAGIYRGEEERPATDLRVYVEDRGGKIVGHIERITGVAFMSTMIDPSEFVGHFEVDTWRAAEVTCSRVLTDKLPGVELSIASVSYRHNKFGEKTFAAPGAADEPRGWRKLIFGRGKNKELASFIDEVVGRAFEFSPEGLKAQKLSLWFTFNGECMQTIYVDIAPQGNRFAISASDRARWPWKEKAIRISVPSAFHAAGQISDYIDRAHGRSLRSLEVYFNWTEALKARV